MARPSLLVGMLAPFISLSVLISRCFFWFAAAVTIFASRNLYAIYHALMKLFGNVLAVATVLLTNNLSNKRQYPIYYMFVPANVQLYAADNLERTIPCLKCRREARKEQTRNKLNISFWLTITAAISAEILIKTPAAPLYVKCLKTNRKTRAQEDLGWRALGFNITR